MKYQYQTPKMQIKRQLLEESMKKKRTQSVHKSLRILKTFASRMMPNNQDSLDQANPSQVLEMTVKYLLTLQKMKLKENISTAFMAVRQKCKSYNEGYMECIKDLAQTLPYMDVPRSAKQSLVNHLGRTGAMKTVMVTENMKRKTCASIDQAFAVMDSQGRRNRVDEENLMQCDEAVRPDVCNNTDTDNVNNRNQQTSSGRNLSKKDIFLNKQSVNIPQQVQNMCNVSRCAVQSCCGCAPITPQYITPRLSHCCTQMLPRSPPSVHQGHYENTSCDECHHSAPKCDNSVDTKADNDSGVYMVQIKKEPDWA